MAVILPNATITLTRGGASNAAGTVIYTGRRVQLTWPVRRAELIAIMAAGGQIIPWLNDEVDSSGKTYQSGDVVTITALDGDTVLPQVTKYRVLVATHVSGFLPHIVCELSGLVGR